MPSDFVTHFEPRKRLHRWSWVFTAIEYVKHFVVPLIAAVVLGAREDEGLWGLVLVVPLVAGAVWHQWIYRYDFAPTSLVIREGLFFRNMRNIEYRRIENIDTERNLLHRLLNVAQVRVETSSGGSSEAVVRVLDLQAVDEMREHIFQKRAATEGTVVAEAAPVEETLLHLNAAELIRYGLIDNRGLIVVAAVVGLVMQVGTEQLLESWLAPVMDTLPLQDFATLAPLLQLFLVLSAVVSLVAGTRILSVLLAFITLYDFTLARAQEDLRIQHGLLTRVALTMRRPRIQAVHQVVSVLHRLFSRHSLTVDLAGGLGGKDLSQDGKQAQARQLWLAPVCAPVKADELIRVALPDVQLDQADWQRLAPGARRRLFRLLAAIWLLLSIPAATWLLGVWAWVVVLPALPLLWLHAHLYVKYTQWALHEKFFAVRRGWLTRRLSVTPRNRVQAVRLSASPFDRRYDMTTLIVDTAGASGRQLRIPFLGSDTAQRLLEALRGSETSAA